MSELITRTARLAPYTKRPRQASGFVTAYTYEPMPGEPTCSFGNLFVVIEVISSGRMAEEVADLVIETVGHHYYNLDLDAEKTHLQRFEAAIKATNAELSHYIDRGNAAWVGKLSAIVAIQTGGELHLAQTGSAEAFLSRGNASTRITAAPGPRGPQPNKTFGAITSGSLEAGDRLLMATPALIHQLPLIKLRSIISSTTPTGAIAEITGLLEGSASDRIAALVVEITTPEQAALQIRPQESNDVILNANETPFELAKQAAAPLAQGAVESSKRLSSTAAQKVEQLKPHLRRLALLCVSYLRRFLTGKNSRRRLAAVAVVVIAILVIVILGHNRSVATSKLVDRFNSAVIAEQSAATRLNGNSKAAAEAALVRIQSDVTALARDKNRASLDQRLAKAIVPEGSPKSVAALQQAIGALLDQAENLQRVATKTLATFDSKTTAPSHFEIIGSKAVTIDATGHTISLVDLTSGAVKTSGANTSQLGSVVATTIASSGDGLYILTQEPAVWFYKPAGDTLTKQTIGQGSWPIASSLASYNGNLYFVDSNSSILRAMRTLAGFGPTAVSSTATTNLELAGARAIAVDGSVYVLSDKGLLQYLSGVLKQTVAVPSGLNHASSLRSIGDGSTLIATDPTTSRAGIFRYSGSALSFSRQFSLNGSTHLYDSTLDPTTNTVYALTEGKLVTFNLR